MKRVLVTGGAGFIGSHTVDFLLQQGLDVVVYDNLSTGKLTNLDLFHPNFRIVQDDILNYPKLLAELSYCDAVIHLAALSSVPKSIENPIQSLKINTQGFLVILEGIRELKKDMRLIYASSASVYGHTHELPCSDETPHLSQVISPYALEKANMERYADLYAHLFGIKSLGLRYFNVYGTRQDPRSSYSGVITKFINCYKQREPMPIFGEGEQSRDFIFVNDVVRANFLALQSDFCGVLNIATGVSETLNNLVRYIEKVGGERAEVNYLPAQAGDILHSYGKTEKAAKNLGFNSSTALEQGIASLCEERILGSVNNSLC